MPYELIQRHGRPPSVLLGCRLYLREAIHLRLRHNGKAPLGGVPELPDGHKLLAKSGGFLALFDERCLQVKVALKLLDSLSTLDQFVLLILFGLFILLDLHPRPLSSQVAL
jgi:hypothetical protein